MSATAVLSYEEREERRKRFARWFAFGPRPTGEPMATRAEILEIPCGFCGAAPGADCDTAFPRPSFLGRAFPGLRGIHTRRYLDRTNDPR